MSLDLIKKEILKEKKLTEELSELIEVNESLVKDNYYEILIKMNNYFLQINELLQLANKKSFINTYLCYETDDSIYKESICTSICNNKVFLKLIKDDGYSKTEDSFIEFDLNINEKISYVTFDRYPYELIIKKIISIWEDYREKLEDDLLIVIKNSSQNKQQLINENKSYIESLKYILES